jgi:hypothetical protein
MRGIHGVTIWEANSQRALRFDFVLARCIYEQEVSSASIFNYCHFMMFKKWWRTTVLKLLTII